MALTLVRHHFSVDEYEQMIELSSLEYDRLVKLPMYAEAGIAEYWIVNLEDDCLEVYRQPTAGGVYNEIRILRRGQDADIAALPGPKVAVDDIL